MEFKIYSKKHGEFNIKIDPEDWKRVKKHNWSISQNRKEERFYVQTHVKKFGKLVKTKLHRFILNAKNGEIVDHINNDPLDNRKENLRICTIAQNSRNRKKRCNSNCKYKGVNYHKRLKKYQANITLDYKRKHLGTFETELEAAIAYNEAALKYHGEYALLNDVEPYKLN